MKGRREEHLVYMASLVLETVMIICEGERAVGEGRTGKVGESNYGGVVDVRTTSTNAR